MKFYSFDLTEVHKPNFAPSRSRDGYCDDTPLYLRVYKEDCGDEWPWHLDAVDAAGDYTEAVKRFATEQEALDARADFVKENLTSVKES